MDWSGHYIHVAGGITNEIYSNKKHLLGVSATSFITVLIVVIVCLWGGGGIYNYFYRGGYP